MNYKCQSRYSPNLAFGENIEGPRKIKKSKILNFSGMTNVKQRVKPKIVISGIGTGGHYFPAIVVAKELLGRNVEVIFLVRKGYFEEEVARMYSLKTFAINPRAFYGKSIFSKILSIFSIIYSLYLINVISKGMVGIAFGGFGSLPLLIACLIHRSPFYLFEPNRIPGRSTKLFASRAKKVFLGLPLVTELKGNLIVTGIPIRQGFRTCVRKRLSKDGVQRKVLFLGGSQGARSLNRLALEVQKILPKEYEIVIICGKRDYKWVNNKRNGRTKVIPFTFSLWDEMQDTDVIVSRAGALAGYEILCSKIPVIFIPFPYAIDDHQYYNAEYFVKIGNAVMIRENELTEKIIVKKIKELMDTKLKKPDITFDAEQRIAEVILKENT